MIRRAVRRAWSDRCQSQSALTRAPGADLVEGRQRRQAQSECRQQAAPLPEPGPHGSHVVLQATRSVDQGWVDYEERRGFQVHQEPSTQIVPTELPKAPLRPGLQTG